MIAEKGKEVVVVNSTSKQIFATHDRAAQVDAAVRKLSIQGKRVVSIVDGPIVPFGPFENVYCEISLFWEQTGQTTSGAPVVNAENFQSVLTRIDLFLEDGDWTSVDVYCEEALNFDATNADLYVKKLLAEMRLKNIDELASCSQVIDVSNNYKKAVRFGDDALKAKLEAYAVMVNKNCEIARLESIYSKAKNLMAQAKTEKAFLNAASVFESVSDYKDSAELIKECFSKAEEARKDAILAQAKFTMSAGRVEDFENAISIFSAVPGWKDADEKAEYCRNKIAEIHAAAAEREAEESKKKKKYTNISRVLVLLIALLLTAVTVIYGAIPLIQYFKAKALADSGEYYSAMQIYEKLDSFLDSDSLSNELRVKFTDRKTVATSGYHTVAVRGDGTVVAVGDNEYGQCDVYHWEDIVAVSAGAYHTVGIKSDGTLVTVGSNEYGQCGVYDWDDIIAVEAGDAHTAGLKSDGTVVVVGEYCYICCEVSEWENVVSLAAGNSFIAGLRSDGTVVVTGDIDETEVSAWKDIVDISAGSYHLIGLKSDGTVVSVGYNDYGECNVSEWTDIVEVTGGIYYSVGLKSDGTLVAVGENVDNLYNTFEWSNLVSVVAHERVTVGLRADGTVTATGNDFYHQCDVGDWKDIKLPEKAEK